MKRLKDRAMRELNFFRTGTQGVFPHPPDWEIEGISFDFRYNREYY